jgi:hypothetical protein
MHIFGLRAVTIKPSLQQSSLLEGCLHGVGILHSGSQGAGATGLGAQAGGGHTGFGAQTGAGAQTGFGAQIGFGAQTGFGGHTGSQVGAGAQTGFGGQIGAVSHIGFGSHTGAASSQHLSAQPTQMRAVAHKKSNEVIHPSCFFIDDSFRLLMVMVDFKSNF